MSAVDPTAADPTGADATLAVAGLEYDVVDVFTPTPFAGNALAVVYGAHDLPTSALQSLAREFNLSETVFATPTPDSTDTDYRVRIFTPMTELPFAGHPSVGAAWALARRGLVAGRALVQGCTAGLVPVQLGVGAGEVTWVGGTDPRVAHEIDPDGPLAATGLGAEDLVGLPTLVAGAGLDFGYLMVRPGAVAKAMPDLRLLRSLRTHSAGLAGVSVVGWHDGTARVRVFTDDIGAAEDPATGSAALGLGVVLVTHGLLDGDATSTFTVRQGVEMGRPSTLHGEVTAAGGRAVSCRVGGEVVAIATGTVRVPPG